MVKSVSGKKKNLRSFTIEYALNKKGCPTKFYNKDYTGRYLSRDAASAAKKAVSQLCRVKRIEGQCVIYVEMRETTQGEGGKIFKYKVRRRKLDEKGPFGNEFEMIAKSLNTKTNKSNPPKCTNPGKSSGRKVSRKNVNKLLKSLK
jgi:hypothetical protein